MFLSNFAVKKPIATIVLILAMMCMGLLALQKLRVNQSPDVEVPFILVMVPYPGASPDTNEREIINRLEKSMQSIPGLTEDVLADRFRGIDGVSTVQVNGSLKRELSVLLHAEKLREYNVSVGDVTNALRSQNTNAPVGKVRGTLDEKSIRLVGRIERPD